MWPFNKKTKDSSIQYAFSDPPNTACIACRHVIKENRDILFVSHDADDGMWQFLCGDEGHQESDGMIVGLKTIIRIDPHINEIADMPFGVCGERKDRGSDWAFYNNPGSA